jgi:type 1 glutamine amidotransferase
MSMRRSALVLLMWGALVGCAASGAGGSAGTPGTAADAAATGGKSGDNKSGDGQGGAGQGGAGGSTAGASGGAPGGSGGAAAGSGGAGPSGSGGGPGAGGAPPGEGGAMAGLGGAGGAGSGDAGMPATQSRKILVYTHSTGYRHASIEAEAEQMRMALTGAGFTVEVSADSKRFTSAALAELRGVVLISTTGKPLGDPGTEALGALDAFVKGGGALIGYHAASSTFYEPPAPYTPLWGGRFVNHPGSVRKATCWPEGSHVSAMRLPASFTTTDEIYVFSNYNDANQVVLRCGALTGDTKLPIAWHRTEGKGRIFYSALGHSAEDFAPGAMLMKDHFLPGALWALGQ